MTKNFKGCVIFDPFSNYFYKKKQAVWHIQYRINQIAGLLI